MVLLGKKFSIPGGAAPWWMGFAGIFLLSFLVINIFRFSALDRIPYGAQVDEIAGAVTLGCVESEGVTPRLEKPGLFIDLNFGSPKPPTFIYPGVVWAKFFGATVASVRAYSGFWCLVAIAGLFFLARLLWGVRFALVVAFLATASPWAWMFSRVAYESIVGPACLVWGLYFFLRSWKAWDVIFSAVFLSAAMYAYPPMRASVPLLMIPIFLYKRSRSGWSWRGCAGFLVALAIVSIPLAQGVLSGELQKRFQDISIFSPKYLASVGKTAAIPDLITIFWGNFCAHLGAGFVFFSGDKNLIYSTGRFGLLSWGDVLGLFALVLALVLFPFRQGWGGRPGSAVVAFLLFCLIGILIGIVPSSLTAEGIPNSLRAIGSWPFVLLIAAFGIWRMTEHWRPTLAAVLLVALIFEGAFLKYYFTEYPMASRGMFGFWSKDMADSAKTEEDWQRFMFTHRNSDYHFQYYLMQYRRETCSSSRTKWRRLRLALGMPPG